MAVLQILDNNNFSVLSGRADSSCRRTALGGFLGCCKVVANRLCTGPLSTPRQRP